MAHTIPYHFIKLTTAAKLDLVTWKIFLNMFNGKSVMYEPHIANSKAVNLFSDSSKKGFGASFGSGWIQGTWPDSWIDFHINILELYPVFALIETFGHKFKNSVFCFHCNNSAVVDVLNKQYTKDVVMMVMVRKIVLKLLMLNTSFFAVNIPGLTNTLCDKSSWF